MSYNFHFLLIFYQSFSFRVINKFWCPNCNTLYKTDIVQAEVCFDVNAGETLCKLYAKSRSTLDGSVAIVMEFVTRFKIHKNR